ncbi:hypothetical protein H4R19_000302 [Coemansia spiralis]|nr:hypothetical protein H4R19_000302 [Coemansia spiralis]
MDPHAGGAPGNRPPADGLGRHGADDTHAGIYGSQDTKVRQAAALLSASLKGATEHTIRFPSGGYIPFVPGFFATAGDVERTLRPAMADAGCTFKEADEGCECPDGHCPLHPGYRHACGCWGITASDALALRRAREGVWQAVAAGEQPVCPVPALQAPGLPAWQRSHLMVAGEKIRMSQSIPCSAHWPLVCQYDTQQREPTYLHCATKKAACDLANSLRAAGRPHALVITAEEASIAAAVVGCRMLVVDPPEDV